MKKKLLFVTLYLHTGGVEKSLLSLLNNLDYNKYDVDLLLFDHQGLLMDQIPEQVTLLPPLFETFSTPLFEAVPALVKGKKYRLLSGKILAAGIAKLSGSVATGQRWMIYRTILPALSKQYDVAISYLDFFCNYYVAEKISAYKKILYNHMNYTDGQKSGWPCPKLERKSFAKSDYIITVAESSRHSLMTFFPEFKNKMRVIHNTVSPEMILTLSKETPCQTFLQKKAAINIVTVARLVEEKGVLIALNTCKRLIENGMDVSWFLIGTGQVQSELKARITKEKLNDRFILLGEKSNPYPYMKLSDIYVQPSLTEAHCVAVEESLALSCNIVATDIPSFQHQLKDASCILVPPDPVNLAKGITDCLHRDFKPEINHCIRTHEKNKVEIEKFYQLIQ